MRVSMPASPTAVSTETVCPAAMPAADEDAPRNRLLLRTSELFQGIQATDQVVLKIAAEKVLIRWKQRG